MISEDSFNNNLFLTHNNDDQITQMQQIQFPFQQQSQSEDKQETPNYQSTINTTTTQQDKQINQTDASYIGNVKPVRNTKILKLNHDYQVENVRDSFKSLNVKELAEQYKKRSIRISSLSIPEYVDVINESSYLKIEPIHFLPPVFASQIENFSYKKDFYSNMNLNNLSNNAREFSSIGKKKSGPNLLNDDEIKYINQNLVDLLDHSLQSTRQNWKRYNKSLFNSQHTSRSHQSSPQHSKMLGSLSNQFAKKEIIKLQLQHNKDQFESARQYSLNQIKTRYNREIQHSLDFKKKIDQLPPIKNYPSRGKILENMMHMQMVKQIHQSNGHQLQEQLHNKRLEHITRSPVPLLKNPKNELGYNLLKIQYKGFWLDRENKGWKPPSRETSRSAICGDLGYCYGGIGMEVLNDFFAINLKTKDWTVLPMKGDYPKEGRYGHSLQVYKKQLVLFGGEKKQSAQAKLKELVNEARILNIDNLEWRLLRCTGDFIEPRRDQASAVVGKNLIIHGGISQKTYCNDMFHLDLCNIVRVKVFQIYKMINTEFNRWQQAICINSQKIFPEGIAYHSCCAVYFSERKNIQLYKPLEDKYADKFNRLKEEGIYFFGGINQSGQTNNIFSILKTDSKPMQFIIPETLGQPPKSRFKHSMILQEQLEWIIIYGGINEDSGKDGFLGDMHMLKLDTLIWREIKFYGQEIVGRCGHLSMSYGSQILIMGGLGAQGIFSMGALEGELDQKAVLKLAQEEVRQVEQKNKRKNTKSVVDKNLAGNINKIKQDLNQTEQAMELQIKIMQSHKESVARLLKKLQFKSQNSFLPIPNQMSDLNHMTSLLVYQNTTSQDQSKLKKKDIINREAEEFNKNDESHNENLKQSSDTFSQISDKSPSPKVKNHINGKIMTKITLQKRNSMFDEFKRQYSSEEKEGTQNENSLSEKNISGFLTPQNKKVQRRDSFSCKREDGIKNNNNNRSSLFSGRVRRKSVTTIVNQAHA